MLPGLRPECLQTTSRGEDYCCLCEENECSIALSPRGDTVLFADGEEVIAEGNRCDCIIVLRRNRRIEVYSIELKGVSNTDEEDALNPDKLRQKWENCLNWALGIVNRLNSVSQRGFNISNYVILVVPEEVRRSIVTLIKRQSLRYKPRLNIDRIQGRILSCNTPITGHADIF